MKVFGKTIFYIVQSIAKSVGAIIVVDVIHITGTAVWKLLNN